MSVVKVKIASIEKIESVTGKYGPQKKVSIKEACEGGDRWLSGFLSEKEFNPDDWKAGKVLELDVWEKEHNGKHYWNFKIPGKNEKKQEEVMVALRAIYKKIAELEVLVKKMMPSGTPAKEFHDDAREPEGDPW